MAQHFGGERGGHAQHGHGDHAHDEVEHASQTGDPTSLDPDDCNACASLCSLTPVLSTAADLSHPLARAALNPAPAVPAPSFVSDGEERPPRTI
jgi:hypothetical protein